MGERRREKKALIVGDKELYKVEKVAGGGCAVGSNMNTLGKLRGMNRICRIFFFTWR